LAAFVLPEILPNSPDDKTKLDESLAVLGRLTEPNFPLALATLLHKLVSPEAAASICRRWKLSNEETDRVVWLLRHRDSLADAKSLRWSQLQPILIAAGIGDLLAFLEAVSPATAESAAFCREKLNLPAETLDPPPLVTGDDLIALGIPQGPQYRVLLEEIRDLQLDEKLKNREDAIRYIKSCNAG
jgi:hypothetical protein